jgi:hypothetical protein
MKVVECPREAELLDAVLSDAWKRGCGVELEAHAENCPVCADLLEVTRALGSEHRVSITEARIPPASVVWWRAEWRLRQNAVRTASRPVSVAQALAAASCVGMIAALIGFLVPSARSLLARLAVAGEALLPEIAWDTGVLMDRIPPNVLVAGIGCCLLLASVAAYWIVSEE